MSKQFSWAEERMCHEQNYTLKMCHALENIGNHSKVINDCKSVGKTKGVRATHDQVGYGQVEEHEVDPGLALLASPAQDGLQHAQVAHKTHQEDAGVTRDLQDVAVVEAHVDGQRGVAEE